MPLVLGPISAPKFEYAALSPMLIVFGAATLGVLVEAFVRRGPRPQLQVGIALAGLVGGLVAVVTFAATGTKGIVASRDRSRSTARLCSCRARSCCWPSAAC